MQQLERPLGGARIALAQSKISVHYADECKPRKMMPLGDKLRADHDVGLSLGDGFQFGLHPLDSAGEIARQDERARLRKQPAHFFFQSLDAGAEGDEGIRRSAFRTRRRKRRLEAAMMA